MSNENCFYCGGYTDGARKMCADCFDNHYRGDCESQPGKCEVCNKMQFNRKASA